jgi:hypothetical protein
VIPENRALLFQFLFVLCYCPTEYFEVNKFKNKRKYMTDVALSPCRPQKEQVL